MSAEIINLRKARKAKARDAANAEAQANRVAFGRTKAERSASGADKALAARKLDAHRLTSAADPPEKPKG
ncbi:MAG: DUF4169 family protein [Bosea sp.]|jgi:hypothetical protein|nr:DUF4169 family protein [Bosea sp. (in: a-proteobacteria)]